VNWLAQMEARRLVLGLREMLVRFDENLAAHALMQSCVPYILEDDPEIERARAEQALKVAHLFGGAEYSQYYATNGHERPFEEQYQMLPEEAHEHLHRVKFLRDWLYESDENERSHVLDVACNDGWMAANLAAFDLTYTGIDLNPDCIERADERQVPGAVFMVGNALDAWDLTEFADPKDGYDVVVAFELVEHVPDPDAVLEAMVSVCKPGGSLFVSTPLGACTGGALDRWWVVEPAGHVRAFTPRSFAELLNRHGTCDGITVSKAGVGELMVARVQVPGENEVLPKATTELLPDAA
jgi:SAM-dependent methyltransferase